jgi:hypothetical protein
MMQITLRKLPTRDKDVAAMITGLLAGAAR